MYENGDIMEIMESLDFRKGQERSIILNEKYSVWRGHGVWCQNLISNIYQFANLGQLLVLPSLVSLISRVEIMVVERMNEWSELHKGIQ